MYRRYIGSNLSTDEQLKLPAMLGMSVVIKDAHCKWSKLRLFSLTIETW